VNTKRSESIDIAGLLPGDRLPADTRKRTPRARDPVGFANEFNDILTVIIGFAELAAADQHIRGDAKLAIYIDEIRKSGLRGSELLQGWVNHAHAGDRIAEQDTAARAPSPPQPPNRKRRMRPSR
jgi:hypothetical protein